MLESLKGAVGGVATFGIVVIGGMAVVGGLTYAGVEIHAKLSKPIGDTQVTTDTNDHTNQEADSAIFNQLRTQIIGYQFTIKQDVAQGNTSAASLTSSVCVEAVNQYDSDAQINNMGPNLPAGYPTSYNLDVCSVPAK